MLDSLSDQVSSLASIPMSQCPVCQVRYMESQTVCCPVCGWDVQPLTLLTGLIPEVIEKEAARLQWAKTLWHSVQAQREKFYQLQLQLQAAIEIAQPIQTPLPHPHQDAIAQTETPLHPENEPRLLPWVEPDRQEQNLPDPVESTASPILSSVPASAMSSPIPDHLPLQKALNVPSTALPNPPISLDRASDDRASGIALVSPSSRITIQEFSFDVITLNQQGTERYKHSAFCFACPLEADIYLDMVLLPGGTFWMGSPDSEAERDNHESPQHEVTIAPFCLSKFPITQAQWQAIAAQPKIQRSLSMYPANFEGDNRPVEQVTWYDAIEFCARLSQHTGQLYRLPSEAEWEYACRANTTTPFHFGDTLLPDWVNYDGNYIYKPGRLGRYRQETTPVGAFKTANAFGLYDMHGNVWEWCADPWHENYHNAPTDGSIWINDDGGVYQVLRGGAWYCLPGLCRSAQRHWNQPDISGSGIGFRVVCSFL